MSARDWSNTDWSLTDAAIAEQLGCSRFPVYRARRVHAPDTIRPPIDWFQADWSKSNDEIAAQLGASYHSVAVKRSELGLAWKGERKPGSGRKRKHITPAPRPTLAYAHAPTVAWLLNKLKDIGALRRPQQCLHMEQPEVSAYVLKQLSSTKAAAHLAKNISYDQTTSTFKAS